MKKLRRMKYALMLSMFLFALTYIGVWILERLAWYPVFQFIFGLLIILMILYGFYESILIGRGRSKIPGYIEKLRR